MSSNSTNSFDTGPYDYEDIEQHGIFYRRIFKKGHRGTLIALCPDTHYADLVVKALNILSAYEEDELEDLEQVLTDLFELDSEPEGSDEKEQERVS